VDSSLGGKTAVNHPAAKNLLGTFHFPRLVVTDPCTLRTLPAKEFSNGMAEVVKTALLGSRSLFEFLESELVEGAGGGRLEEKRSDVDFVERCVAECVAVKSRIVAVDPKERGLRRVLNLGHTIGHALEAAAGYSRLSHGEAVSLGLVAALEISLARGLIERELLDRTVSVLSACGLPVRAPSLDRERVRKALALDKKRRQGAARLVLLQGVGSPVVVEDATDGETDAALSKILSG